MARVLTTGGKGATLAKCLASAEAHWRGVAPESCQAMVIGAKTCVTIIGENTAPKKLGAKDAGKILSALSVRVTRGGKRLSRKSVSCYYGAFKRMLQLNGVTPDDYTRWPEAPKPPRKTREAIAPEDFDRIYGWLVSRSYHNTSDLILLLRFLGARIQREVLREGNLRVRTRNGQLLIHVTGKGDNERWVPVRDRNAKAILSDKHRMAAIRAVPYKTHLKRWNTGRRHLEIKGLATPHALRHTYATEALRKSGGNLRLVQELLGHSNPATTAIYAEVDMDAKVEALR